MLISKVRTYKYLFVIPVSIIICVFIANRNQYLPDYQMYLRLFQVENDYVEFSYNFFSDMFNRDPDNFIYFLFFYAIISFGMKMIFSVDYILEKRGWTIYLLFILTYVVSFFVLWDMIQIRYSAGISMLVFGIFNKNIKYKFLFFLLAIMLHSSMLFPVVCFLGLSYIKNIKLKWSIVPVFAFAILIAVFFSGYSSKYNAEYYGVDNFKIYSGVYILVYMMLVIFFVFRRKIVPEYKNEIYSLYLTSLIMVIIMVSINSLLPAAADRLANLVCLLLVICLFFISAGKEYFYLMLSFIFIYNAWMLKVYIFNPHGILTYNNF